MTRGEALGGATLLIVALLPFASSCASAPKYDKKDCETFTETGQVRVNPAFALDRHFSLEAAFVVCPPGDGSAEMRRKRIELKHELISLLSSKTQQQLEDPLRAEKLRGEIMMMANKHVLKRSEVIDVYITSMKLE